MTRPLVVGAGAAALVLAVAVVVLALRPPADTTRDAPDDVVTARERPASPPSEQQALVLARLALARAEAALGEGELERSRAAADEALALAPALADAVRLLAVVEKRAGRVHEACRLMRDYVGRAATPEPARARLLASACDGAAAP